MTPAQALGAYGAGATDTRTNRDHAGQRRPAVAGIGAIGDSAWVSGNGSIIAVLKGIFGKLGSLVTGVVLAAGSAIIGKVGIDQSTPGTTDSVTVATAQGAGAAIGAVNGAKVITDANGTIQQYLRGLITQWIAGTLVIGAGTNMIGNVGHGKTIKTASVSFNTNGTNDIVALVSSKRIKVIAYAFFKTGTNANPLIIKSNTTEIARVLLQSQASAVFGANLATAAPSFLFGTAAGEKLSITTSDTDLVTGFVTYFDDDAT
jgi:hypothetical protein